MTNYERTTIERTVDDAGAVETSTGRVVRPVSARTTTVDEEIRTSASGATVARRVVIALFGIAELLLLLRVVLLLLVANQDNAIVRAVMAITDVFVEPFRGMFAMDSVTGATGSVLDVAAIVAMIGLAIVEAIILAVLRVGDRSTAMAA